MVPTPRDAPAKATGTASRLNATNLWREGQPPAARALTLLSGAHPSQDHHRSALHHQPDLDRRPAPSPRLGPSAPSPAPASTCITQTPKLPSGPRASLPHESQLIPFPYVVRAGSCRPNPAGTARGQRERSWVRAGEGAGAPSGVRQGVSRYLHGASRWRTVGRSGELVGTNDPCPPPVTTHRMPTTSRTRAITQTGNAGALAGPSLTLLACTPYMGFPMARWAWPNGTTEYDRFCRDGWSTAGGVPPRDGARPVRRFMSARRPDTRANRRSRSGRDARGHGRNERRSGAHCRAT
jgi:hypothetical protein